MFGFGGSKSPKSPQDMKKMAERAEKKFNELDANGNGVLEGDELVGLAEWVWSAYHPDGKPLPEEEKKAMIEKLLHRIDENEDGELSLDEFKDYYFKTAESISRFRRRGSQLKATEERKKKGLDPALTVTPEPITYSTSSQKQQAAAVASTTERAAKKFQELDKDGNGVLEGDELVPLAEWVWSSFHPDGEPISGAEKKAMVEKLMHRADENDDGQLSLEEFKEYFMKTAASIARFRQRPAQVKAAKERSRLMAEYKKAGNKKKSDSGWVEAPEGRLSAATAKWLEENDGDWGAVGGKAADRKKLMDAYKTDTTPKKKKKKAEEEEETVEAPDGRRLSAATAQWLEDNDDEDWGAPEFSPQAAAVNSGAARQQSRKELDELRKEAKALKEASKPAPKLEVEPPKEEPKGFLVSLGAWFAATMPCGAREGKAPLSGGLPDKKNGHDKGGDEEEADTEHSLAKLRRGSTQEM